MKSKYLKLSLSLFVSLLFLTNINAQKNGKVIGDGNVITDTREVGSFDNIGVSGSFDVNLVKGKEGKIEIKIEKNLLPYLITEVKDGELKIKWKKGTNIRNHKGVHLTVYFNSINGVALSGSGEIIGKDLIESNNFNVAISGSGDINLNLKVNNIESRISGSGDLTFKGSTKTFTSSVSGSGDIEAYGLQTDKADIKVSGSGDMTITVNSELYARVSGSGDISYKGNPSKEDVKVSGSGNISSH